MHLSYVFTLVHLFFVFSAHFSTSLQAHFFNSFTGYVLSGSILKHKTRWVHVQLCLGLHLPNTSQAHARCFNWVWTSQQEQREQYSGVSKTSLAHHGVMDLETAERPKAWESPCHVAQLFSLPQDWQTGMARASVLLNTCMEVSPQTLSTLHLLPASYWIIRGDPISPSNAVIDWLCNVKMFAQIMLQ